MPRVGETAEERLQKDVAGRENRRRAVSHVSTGLACLPRDTGGMRNYRRRAVVERCCWKVRHCLWSNGFSRMVAIPLTQLSRNRRCKISCKNIFLDLYNRSSAVDSSSATDPRLACLPGAMIIQPPFGGCPRHLIDIDKTVPHRYVHRRGATTLFHNPVRADACWRYATACGRQK